MERDGQFPAGHISEVRVRQALAYPGSDAVIRIRPFGRARGQQIAGGRGRSVDTLVHAYSLNDGGSLHVPAVSTRRQRNP